MGGMVKKQLKIIVNVISIDHI